MQKPDLNCEIVGESVIEHVVHTFAMAWETAPYSFCDISREASTRFIGEALLDIIDHCVAKIQPRQRRRFSLKFPSLSPAALTQGRTSWSPSKNDFVEFVSLSKRVFESSRGSPSTRVFNKKFNAQVASAPVSYSFLLRRPRKRTC